MCQSGGKQYRSFNVLTTSSLEKLVEENTYYKGKNHLSKAARVKIVSAVRCAIRLRSMETDKQAAVRLLQHDIHNSVHHVFGNYSRCADFYKSRQSPDTVHHVFGNHSICADFCKSRQSPDTAISADVNTKLDGNEQVSNDENIPDIFKEISHIWSETTSLQLQEDSRGDCNISENFISMIIRDASVLLDRMAKKAPKLLGNYTTNLAESWMSIRASFDGGKLYNCCKGSWHSRCYGGSLRMNLGAFWSTVVWEKCTSSVPGKYFQKIYLNRERALAATKKSHRKSEIRARRMKRNYQSTKDSNSKKARLEYGPGTLDVVPELTPDELDTKKQAFLDTRINLSHQQIMAIEKLMTIREYKLLKIAKELQTHWFDYISDNKYLAASPDGKVVQSDGDVGLIEIKNLLHSKHINLTEASKDKVVKDFCLEYVEHKNTLQLKRTHSQLNVSKLPWLDFVVRTLNPYQLHVERIVRDENL
ncbi:hypothetical protein KUTeg_022883 [Tegillarca granosa]|uniref:YqaJ viral recombinase domain-containing protein n=1 Tax=Tegillarca granosa TaxID=220873 RepID=A0ABQ9E023_TEGGR|nr:hypothetical protein KUTeg_022883 [Tegillarca granosa]